MTLSQKPTWHFWAIAVVSLLWNAMGAVDYTMTHTQSDMWLAGFGDEERAYIAAFPAWAVAFWALGVWGSFLGSIFLLLRKSWAVPAFGVSIIGLIGATVYQYGFDRPASFDTPGMMAFSAVIWIITLFLFWYSRQKRAQGVLG